MLMIQHPEVAGFKRTRMHRTVNECIEVLGEPSVIIAGVNKRNMNRPGLRSADAVS